MTLTKPQAIDWINQSIGKYYNPDGAYGYQCKDYADAYATALFGSWADTLRPNDAKYVFDGANSDFFEKIRNNPDPNLIPQSGDIIIYNGWGGNPYGHIEVVLDANISGMTVVYQDGFAQIPATKTFRSYGQLPIIGWLRPKYQTETPAVQQDNTWRKVSAEQGVNVRNEPTTKSGIFATYPKDSEIQMKGFCKGETVNGSDIWFISARSTKFIHISALDKGTEDLPHLAEYDQMTAEPEQKVEVQAPPIEKPAEYLNFNKEFDFVDRVEAIATTNLFYGRKNLKDENGKYLSAIPDNYEEQKLFVESLNRPHVKIEEITIHNTANNSINATLSEFRRKDSYKSSHLIVSNNEIIQCVKTSDTAFTNGKHESNIASFTIEFLDDVSDERYVEVLKKISEALNIDKIGKHRDHSATQCPAKLSDERFSQILAKVHQKTEVKTGIISQKEAESDMSQNTKNHKFNLRKEDFMQYIKELEELQNKAQQTAEQVEYTPVISEDAKRKTYFTTGWALIITVLSSTILTAFFPQHAILILAIAGGLNTAYASINQLYKISSNKR